MPVQCSGAELVRSAVYEYHHRFWFFYVRWKLYEDVHTTYVSLHRFTKFGTSSDTHFRYVNVQIQTILATFVRWRWAATKIHYVHLKTVGSRFLGAANAFPRFRRLRRLFVHVIFVVQILHLYSVYNELFERTWNLRSPTGASANGIPKNE
jgi:hypothetical protein